MAKKEYTPDEERGFIVVPEDELGLVATPEQLVTDRAIKAAVRAHLHMSTWVPVDLADPTDPADPGTWTIRTTDISADGQWCIDGETDGKPNISVMMAQYATGGAPGFEVSNTVDFRDPADDIMGCLYDCKEDVSRTWQGILDLMDGFAQRDDPGLLREAADRTPDMLSRLAEFMGAIRDALIDRDSQR